MKKSFIVLVSLVVLIFCGYYFLYLSFTANKGENEIVKTNNENESNKLDIAVVSNFNLNPASGQVYGEHLKRGISMCINEYEDSDKEEKIKIEIKYFDYGTSLSEAVNIAQEIVKCDSFDCVIGYNYSSFALAVADIFEKNLLPLVTIATTSTLQKYEYVLQVGNTNKGMARKIGDLGHQRKGVKLILVDNDSDYSLNLTKEIVEYFSSLGDSTRSVYINEVDFNKIGEEIFKDDIGVVIIPTHEIIAKRLLENFLTKLNNQLIIGGDGWGSGLWIKDILIEDNSNELYCISHWHNSVNPSFVESFLMYYSDGYSVSDNTALGYDAVKIILKAYKTSDINGSIQKIPTNLNYFSSMGRFYTVGKKEFVVIDASRYPFELKE